MEITTLPPGELAPKDADCIHIEHGVEGGFHINCTALRPSGDGEEAESVALIGSDPYDSYEAAENAGLAWADAEGVTHVYLSRSKR